MRINAYSTARVVPTGVQASPAVLTTNVHLKFDDKVEQRIKTFLVQVSSNEFRDQVTTKSILPCDRMATIHHLAPGTAYSVRVVAVYEDGMEAMSKICTFTTAGTSYTNNHAYTCCNGMVLFHFRSRVSI